MICGIDEAGRGPVLGPLVVAGVKLETDKDLKSLNVRDSKKLSADRRINLAKEITKISEIELVFIPAIELDVLRQVMSLNEIEALAFSKIIMLLKPERVYVDCVDTNEENFKKNLLSKLKYRPEVISRHGADDIYPVVSAASIIAKTRRDAEVQRITGEIGTDIGSGYPSDDNTINFMKKWLSQNRCLPPYTRYGWKTTQRLMEDFKFKPTKLTDFQD